MKEQMTYVAIDADDVGESVGNAVLSNDANKLSFISNNINAGVQIFAQWAQHNGGKVISSGSDEAVVQVPVTSIEELEQLKEEYSKKTGFTVSIGIGETISDSAKALIYAKMNGKNQIMDYSPEMEQTMKQSLSGGQQQAQQQEQAPNETAPENQLEGGLGDSTQPEEVDQEQLSMGIQIEMEHTNDEGKAKEIALDHLSEDPEYYSKLNEMENPKSKKIDVPADQVDGDYGSEEMADAQPEHEKQMGEEEEFVHDAQENRDDELDSDIIEADAEEEIEQEIEQEIEGESENPDEALDNLADSSDPADEDIDLDGVPDEQEEHGQIDPSVDDIDQDGDVEHEEAMAAEAGEEAVYSDEGDSADEDLGEEDEELSQSIAAEMGEEEAPMEEGMEGDFAEEIPAEDQDQVFEEEAAVEQEMQDDMGAEGTDHDSLKSVIFESLQNFKQNRQYLESISQENPELYNSLIYCLQAMIEMAKELGYGGMADEMGEEEVPMEEGMEEDGDMLSDEDEAMGQEMEEEAPMEEDMEEEPVEDEIEEDSEAEDEDKEEQFFEKNERFISLMAKMNKAFSQLNITKGEKENIQEIKEKIKQKIENKRKQKPTGSKKGAIVKKPGLPVKKKKPQKKQSNDGSFCAKSHKKMRASGKDCRANEDKDSPLCSARKKFSCRGKNEEKSKSIEKSEKLLKFMSNSRKK